MARATQTENGKAFEYACLKALFDKLSPSQPISIITTPQYETAKNFFSLIDSEMRENLYKAALRASEIIIRLEPQLEYPDKNIPLVLSLQADAEGMKGDVRDVLCIRRQNEWEIGLSCKHNHKAVKHSRLSATIDFESDLQLQYVVVTQLAECQPSKLDAAGSIPVYHSIFARVAQSGRRG